MLREGRHRSAGASNCGNHQKIFNFHHYSPLIVRKKLRTSTSVFTPKHAKTLTSRKIPGCSPTSSTELLCAIKPDDDRIYREDGRSAGNTQEFHSLMPSSYPDYSLIQ